MLIDISIFFLNLPKRNIKKNEFNGGEFRTKKNKVLSHDDTIIVTLYVKKEKAFIKTCLLGGCACACTWIIVITFHVFILKSDIIVVERSH